MMFITVNIKTLEYEKKSKKFEHEGIQWNLHTERNVETVSCTVVGIKIIIIIRNFISRSKFKKLSSILSLFCSVSMIHLRQFISKFDQFSGLTDYFFEIFLFYEVITKDLRCMFIIFTLRQFSNFDNFLVLYKRV